MKGKEIHFYKDCTYPLGLHVCHTCDETKRYIEIGVPIIHSTSLVNLSFDLLDKGYRIFLHQNYKVIEAKPGMEGTVRDVRKEHNVMKMWVAGIFDDYFWFTH